MNVQVIYGVAGKAALNVELWELAMCYTSALGNSPQIILTDTNFDLDNLRKMPYAPRTALADGWPVDADAAFAQLQGIECVSKYTQGSTHARIDTMFISATHFGCVAQVTEVQDHGLPGHTTVCYSLDLQAPCQQVVKLRKIKRFDPAPREDEEFIALCDTLIAPHKTVWQRMLETGQSTDDLWAHWAWVAGEVGLALGCLDLRIADRTALCTQNGRQRSRHRPHAQTHHPGPVPHHTLGGTPH